MPRGSPGPGTPEQVKFGKKAEGSGERTRDSERSLLRVTPPSFPVGLRRSRTTTEFESQKVSSRSPSPRGSGRTCPKNPGGRPKPQTAP